MYHMPTILVTETDEHFPQIIPWLEEETKEGRMSPQIHGYAHVDYNKLSPEEIREHLEKCLTWFDEHLQFQPTIWATPWGATSDKISKAAREFSLTVQGVTEVVAPDAALRAVQQLGISCLHGEVIMEHWWQKGLRILRLVECLKYGSYEAARKARDDLFS